MMLKIILLSLTLSIAANESLKKESVKNKDKADHIIALDRNCNIKVRKQAAIDKAQNVCSCIIEGYKSTLREDDLIYLLESVPLQSANKDKELKDKKLKANITQQQKETVDTYDEQLTFNCFRKHLQNSSIEEKTYSVDEIK